MKRTSVLFGVMALLAILAVTVYAVENTTWGKVKDEAASRLGEPEVLAKQGAGLPHPGGCAAYCARSVVYKYVGPHPASLKDPLLADLENEAYWEPADLDGDGKLETCLQETACIRLGGCPESDGDGDGENDRCALPQDAWPGDGLYFWCRLMHGPNTY